MSWSKSCKTSEISVRLRIPGNPGTNQPVYEMTAIQATGATLQINNAKIHVPVVTLSINDNIKFFENIKQGFKRKNSWNKQRPEITTQTKNNNLDYLIDPTFSNINRLFVLWFKNGSNAPKRKTFDKCYMPLVKIKDFNALIDNKPFFDQALKNKQNVYEKLIEMSKNDAYTTGNLLDNLYHQKFYEVIGIDLSRQKKHENSSTN